MSGAGVNIVYSSDGASWDGTGGFTGPVDASNACMAYDSVGNLWLVIWGGGIKSLYEQPVLTGIMAVAQTLKSGYDAVLIATGPSEAVMLVSLSGSGGVVYSNQVTPDITVDFRLSYEILPLMT